MLDTTSNQAIYMQFLLPQDVNLMKWDSEQDSKLMGPGQCNL